MEFNWKFWTPLIVIGLLVVLLINANKSIEGLTSGKDGDGNEAAQTLADNVKKGYTEAQASVKSSRQGIEDLVVEIANYSDYAILNLLYAVSGSLNNATDADSSYKTVQTYVDKMDTYKKLRDYAEESLNSLDKSA
jgi:hypothetical protein